MSRRVIDRAGVFVCAGAILLQCSASIAAQAQTWTLESTVLRALEVAPERHAAESAMEARQGDLRQAGAWPNPTLELGASNAMGKEDGRGGTDFNEISVRQALPVSGRLDRQRQQADAVLTQAKAELAQQNLRLEYEAARVFHALQLNRALSALARQRLESADDFQHIGRRREQAGDLSRLERLRLDLIRENASQLIASAEGEESESLSDFQTLMNLADAQANLAALDQPPALPDILALEAGLQRHPALEAARQGVEAARREVDVRRAKRFADPELWVSRGRDYLGGRREDVTAFGIALSLPLWDRGRGHIDAARAEQQKAQYELDALQRQLGNRTRLNHLHLSHLIEQAEDYRLKVLGPAEEIFQLTRKGFAAGEVEILHLVDAVDNYFNARARYLELLQTSWLESAELRRAAGVFLLASPSPVLEGNVQ